MTYKTKINTYLLIILLLLLTVVSCGDDSDGEFWAQNIEGSFWYKVPATELYNGSKCIIYGEDASLALINKTIVNNVGAEFDNKIYDLITSKFGNSGDVDNNGKIIILLLDIKDGFTGSGGYIAGYFDSTHMYDNPNSNKADMIFMDINPGIIGDEDFMVTIAHEFQHLVNFYQKVFVQGSTTGQDTWINEGLSSAAEHLYLGKHIDWKIDYYNNDTHPTKGAKVIARGQNFVSWGTWGDPLANYSTVYLFFQWLRLQSSLGVDIYKNIIDNSFDDYRSVEAMASGISATWKELLRDWFIANAFNDPTGKYGYKGDIAPLTLPLLSSLSPLYYTSGTNFPLRPGDAVYVSIFPSADMTVSGSIGYAGLNTATSAVDVTGSMYSGNLLLSYNFNGNPSTSTENTAPLSAMIIQQVDVTVSSAVSRSVSPESSSRTIFPIDLIINSDGKHSLGRSIGSITGKKNEYKK